MSPSSLVSTGPALAPETLVSCCPRTEPRTSMTLGSWFSWRDYRLISVATLFGSIAVLMGLIIVLHSIPRESAADGDPPPQSSSLEEDTPTPLEISVLQIALHEFLQSKPTPEPPQTIRSSPVVEQLAMPRIEEPILIRAVANVVPALRPNKGFKRFNLMSEESLRQQLALAEEVGLGISADLVHMEYTANFNKNSSKSGSKGVADASAILKLRPDLGTLKIRDGKSSVLPHKKGVQLDVHSRKLRVYLNNLAPVGPDGLRPVGRLKQQLEQDLRNGKPEWLHVNAVPALTQLLMADDTPTRLLLVQLLKNIPEKPATLALAQRAVFDLNPEVRREAVEALAERDPTHWRSTFLDALEYPWPPVADFAAEGIVNLRQENLIPELIYRLRKTRPGRPEITPDHRVVVREVVKIRHLSNCLLCHPPSLTGTDPVIGLDPVVSLPGPLTTDSTVIARVQQQFGGHDYGMIARKPAFAIPQEVIVQGKRMKAVPIPVPARIRGDITFLHQDFSVSYPVVRPDQRPPLVQIVLDLNPELGRALGLMPPPVRFDFVVRTRPIDGKEWERWKKLEKNDPIHPQRDALLYALRELSGQDLGPSTEAWDRAYPNAVPEAVSDRLADRLARVSPLERSARLLNYQTAKGHEYTWALAKVMPQLEEPSREMARRTLVRRLVGQTPELWRLHLSRDNEYLRRAVVEACREKGDRLFLTELVPYLDSDSTTSKAIRELLHEWTGQSVPDISAWYKLTQSLARTVPVDHPVAFRLPESPEPNQSPKPPAMVDGALRSPHEGE